VSITALSTYCGAIAGGTNITVKGTNLLNTGNLECKFTFKDDKQKEYSVKAIYVDDETIVCPVPAVDEAGSCAVCVCVCMRGRERERVSE